MGGEGTHRYTCPHARVSARETISREDKVAELAVRLVGGRQRKCSFFSLPRQKTRLVEMIFISRILVTVKLLLIIYADLILGIVKTNSTTH